MTDSGLSTRLRHQSRRSGLMVGITMVLALAICIFGAAALYGALAQPFSDLIPMVAPAGGATSGGEEEFAPTAEAPVAAANEVALAPDETPQPTAAATAAPTEQAFEPTHQIGSNSSVNFRSGPSTGDSVIIALSPATPLQFLEEEVPSDEGLWMRFRTENGDEGWVLEELTVPYQP